MRLAILLIFFYINIAYAEDLAQQYYNQNPSEERKIIIDSITKQFIEKKLIGVSQKELDQVWNDKNARETLHIARFQIIDSKLFDYIVNDKGELIYSKEKSMKLRN